jgi:hypothetical protein
MYQKIIFRRIPGKLIKSSNLYRDFQNKSLEERFGAGHMTPAFAEAWGGFDSMAQRLNGAVAQWQNSVTL